MEARALQINAADDVAVLLSPAIAAGTHLGGLDKDITTLSSVMSGHKVALHPIKAGTPIIKYGQPFAIATEDIAEGEWVHTHNARTALGANEAYTFSGPTPSPAAASRASTTFPPLAEPFPRTRTP